MITGLNLGPAEGAKAPGNQWPTELAGVQVLLNGTQIPVGSADLGTVIAQVPLEARNGSANVAVRRNGASSAPARVNIVASAPGVETADGSGFGEAATTVNGNTVTLSVTGLGVTDPRIPTGSAGPADSPAVPRAPVTVHVGGLMVNAQVAASSDRVGEFAVTFTVADGARPGDLLSLQAGGRVANYTLLQKAIAPELRFLPLPAGVPDLRALTASDLRGGYSILTGARDANGCYAGWLADTNQGTVKKIDACLTTGNPNAPSPVTAAQEGGALAALVGPPGSDPQAGVSSQVVVFNPLLSDPVNAQLPSAATALIGANASTFAAILSGQPPSLVTIDAMTGQVNPAPAGAGLGGFGGGPGGGAGAALLNLNIDLGGGLNKVLSLPVQVAPGTLAVVVGDDEDKPTKAKVALLNTRGEVTDTRDFPAGWLPLVPPVAPTTGGVGPGGPGFPGGGGAFLRTRTATYNDTATGTLYIVSRKADDTASGFVALKGTDVKAIAHPSGWYTTSCTQQVGIATIDLARRIAVFGSNKRETEFQRQCNALGFLVLDLDAGQVTAVPVPGSGQISASGRVDDINNDLLTASPNSDTAYVMDGVTLSMIRLDLPAGLASFGTPTLDPALGIAVATGTVKTANDGGFVIFDIANAQTRVLPVPDGFATAQLVGIFTSTQKLVARGIKPNNAGTQYLIYDLVTGDLQMPPNPAGVAFVGTLPAAQTGPPGPGGQGPGGGAQAVLQRVNVKANTVEAVTYSADRKQNGVMTLRVQ